MRFSRRAFTISAASAPLVPMLTRAQSATPAPIGFEDANVRIADVLQYVPGGILDDELDLIWNDHERHVAALRQHAGTAAEEQSNQQMSLTSLMANAPGFMMYAPFLKEYTGFSYDALIQTIGFYSAPNTCLIAKLNQPAEDIVPFLESTDYTVRDNEYGQFWTIGEDGELDFNHPVQSRMLNKKNNVAMIAEDVLAYAPTSELLAQIMSTAAGSAPNRIAELEPILSGLLEDSASAWFLDSEVFDFRTLTADSVLPEQAVQRIEEMIAESDSVVGPMPVLCSVAAGVTAGGSLSPKLHNPETREHIVLETDEAGMAQQAADVITWRYENMHSLMNNGAPYSLILPSLEIEVIDGETLRATARLERTRMMLASMVGNRDILLFGYESPQ